MSVEWDYESTSIKNTILDGENNEGFRGWDFSADEIKDKKFHGKVYDKKDRATVENVLDPRTRLILYKLVRNGFLDSIHGCVSTGKEANVYYAVLGSQSPAAIKIYRTSVLIFKDRERYVKGDFRFQRYSKSNPRKMVQKWAEKEARNLRRLEAAGIPAPRVLQLKQHVLIMSFLGENGWPYPRLQDVANLKYQHGTVLYRQSIHLLRRLYAECNIVHGDFSEYNLLLHKHEITDEDSSAREDESFRFEIYVIDVSQSVEPDHPNAMEFLRRDIVNIDRFFGDALPCETRLSIEQIFMFITGRVNSLDLFKHSESSTPDDVFRRIPIPLSLAAYGGSHISSDVEKQYNFLKVELGKNENDEKTDFDLNSVSDALDLVAEQSEKYVKPKEFKIASATKEERKEHRQNVKLQNRERRLEKSKRKTAGKK